MIKGKEKIILVKATSGLGNRIFAVATAILYAEISGRKIIIDWSEGTYAKDGINAFEIFFDCPFAKILEDLPNTNSIFPTIWKGNLDKSLGEIKLIFPDRKINDLSIDISKLNYKEDIIVFSAYTHKITKMRNLFRNDFKHYQKMDNKAILRKVVNEKMPLKQKWKDQFNEFKKSNFGKHNIGVHIRYSDMKIPLEKIYKTLDKILFYTKDSPIFLSTDSEKIMNEFKIKYKNVITTEKWFPPSGKKLHQNWDECPDPLQNAIEALRDLYLLSECETLIFSSQSSFGYLASLWNTKGKLYDIENSSFCEKIKGKLQNLLKKIY